MLKRKFAAGFAAAIAAMGGVLAVSTPASAASAAHAVVASSGAAAGNSVFASATLPGTPPKLTASNHHVATGGKQGVKGLPGKVPAASSQVNTAQSPNGVKPLTACSPPCFLYNNSAQSPPSGTTGVLANFRVSQPYLSTSDYHSLAEIAVQSPDGQQTVEVGWNVDHSVNGDYKPHLFVFHWVNGVPGTYNGSGFVQYTGTGSTLAGADLSASVGTLQKFDIEYTGGAWWIGYGSGWVGYFPGSLWSGATPPATFTTDGYNQLFGEIAASTTTPCTDMGDGLLGNAANANPTTGAASISSTTYVGTATLPSLTYALIPSTSEYTEYAPSGSTRSFYYGGPGYNAAGTGIGTTGSC